LFPAVVSVTRDARASKTVVLKLVEELDFDGVDAGGLDESWRQQPGTPVYTKDLDADGVRRAMYEERPHSGMARHLEQPR